MKQKVNRENKEKLLRYFFIYGINTLNISSMDNFYKIRTKKPEILDSFCITGKEDKKYKIFIENKLSDLSSMIFPSNIDFWDIINIKEPNLDINRPLYYDYVKKERIKYDKDNKEILPENIFHCFIVKKAGEAEFGDIQWYVNCYIYWERIRNNIIIAKALLIVTYQPCLSLCFNILKNLYEKIHFCNINDIDFKFDQILFEIFNKCEISFQSNNIIKINNLIDDHVIPYSSYLPLCDINLFYFFNIFTLEELFFLVQQFLLRQRVLIICNKLEYLFAIFHIIHICSHPLEASDSVNFYKLLSPSSNLKFSEFFSANGKCFSLYAYSQTLFFDCSNILDDISERSKVVNTMIILNVNENQSIAKQMIQKVSGVFNPIKIVNKKSNKNNLEETPVFIEIEPFIISQLKNLKNYQFNEKYEDIKALIGKQKDIKNINQSFYDYDSKLNIISIQILQIILELNSMFLLSLKPHFEFNKIYSQNSFIFQKEIVEKNETGRISGDFNDLASYSFNDIKNKFNHDSIDHIYITQLINLFKFDEIFEWNFMKLKNSESIENQCIINLNFPNFDVKKKDINSDFCVIDSSGQEIQSFAFKKIDPEYPQILNLSKLNNIEEQIEKNINEEKEILPFYAEIINYNIFEKLNIINLKEINKFLISQVLYVFLNSYFLINGYMIIQPNNIETSLKIICDNILKIFQNCNEHFKQFNFVLYIIQKLSFTYEYMNAKAKSEFFGKIKEYNIIQPFGVSDLYEKYEKELKNLQKSDSGKINILIKQEEDIKRFIFEEGNFTFFNDDDSEVLIENIIINKENFTLENKESKKEVKVKFNNESFEIISPCIILNSIMDYFINKGNTDFPKEIIQNPKSEIYDNWNRDIRNIIFYGICFYYFDKL